MREDTKGREYPAARFLEGLGMTFGVRWGERAVREPPLRGGREGGERGGGDLGGSPHARGTAARFLEGRGVGGTGGLHHEGPLRGMGMGEGEGWVPACARTREGGDGRFANRPYGVRWGGRDGGTGRGGG